MIAAALLVSAGAAPCATIHVPDDVGDIGLALLLSADSDTVLVAPGVYRVNIEWPVREGLTLISEAGPSQTTLDGSGDIQVIGIYSGVDTTTVISGFTIMNGHAEGQ
jgi:hypothetical protein